MSHRLFSCSAQMDIQPICRALVESGDPMTDTVVVWYYALHLAVKIQHFYVVTYLVTNRIYVNKLSLDKNDEIVSYLDYNNAKPSR